MSEILMYTLKPAILIFAMLVGMTVIMRLMRSRLIPRCVCCGSSRVRRMHTRGLLERIGRLLRVRAHRCERCMEEFYAILWLGTARGHFGGLRITFKKSNGAFQAIAIRRVVLERTRSRRRGVSRSPATLQA